MLSDESFPAASSESKGLIPSVCSLTFSPETYASPVAACDGMEMNVAEAVDNIAAVAVMILTNRLPNTPPPIIIFIIPIHKNTHHIHLVDS